MLRQYSGKTWSLTFILGKNHSTVYIYKLEELRRCKEIINLKLKCRQSSRIY